MSRDRATLCWSRRGLRGRDDNFRTLGAAESQSRSVAAPGHAPTAPPRTARGARRGTLRRGAIGRVRRRRAAPALRPAAAVEGAARGRAGARRSSCCAGSPYDDLDLDLRLGTRRPRSTSTARVVELDDGDRVAVRRPRDRHRRRARAACPTSPSSTACSCCARSTTPARSGTGSRPARGSCVIGAGFIGSEVAATCRGRGLDVTVLEALPQPMVRGLGRGARRGAAASCTATTASTCAAAWGSRRSRATAGSSACGSPTATSSTADVVRRRRRRRARRPTGSKAAGLTLDNGVVCDETLLAAPGVVAAGDVARWPNPLFDGELDAARALDQRDRAGRVRGASACSSATRERRAVRAGAVRVVRPVRREDPDRRRASGPTTRSYVVHGIARRAPVRRALRARRAASSARSGSAGPATSCSTGA